MIYKSKSYLLKLDKMNSLRPLSNHHTITVQTAADGGGGDGRGWGSTGENVRLYVAQYPLLSPPPLSFAAWPWRGKKGATVRSPSLRY